MIESARFIETERLHLRWLTIDDTELMLEIWNDPAFVRYVGDRGIRSTDEAAQALADGPLKLYEDYGFGPYRLALRDTDTAIGICGLFRREGLDDPDVGFALLPEFCGKGYAKEAAEIVVAHAKNELALPRLTAIVSPENVASIGLIEKLGLRFERMIQMPGESENISLYGVDW